MSYLYRFTQAVTYPPLFFSHNRLPTKLLIQVYDLSLTDLPTLDLSEREDVIAQQIPNASESKIRVIIRSYQKDLQKGLTNTEAYENMEKELYIYSRSLEESLWFYPDESNLQELYSEIITLDGSPHERALKITSCYQRILSACVPIFKAPEIKRETVLELSRILDKIYRKCIKNKIPCHHIEAAFGVALKSLPLLLGSDVTQIKKTLTIEIEGSAHLRPHTTRT